jgi:hypothetical protein
MSPHQMLAIAKLSIEGITESLLAPSDGGRNG